MQKQNCVLGLLTFSSAYGVYRMQLMSLLRDYDVTWPSSTIQLLSYSDSLNLGISITAPQCFVPGYNFFVFYIATMAQPVSILQ